MNTIAVFRARNDAIRVYDFLRKKGVACAVVSTPSSLKTGCGLSVVFPSSSTSGTDEAIRTLRVRSFVGYFPR